MVRTEPLLALMRAAAAADFVARLGPADLAVVEGADFLVTVLEPFAAALVRGTGFARPDVFNAVAFDAAAPVADADVAFAGTIT